MRISDWSSDVCSSDLPPSQTVEANGSIQQTVEEVQSSADRIRQAMEVQAQTVTMITAAVDETALAADSMSSTISAIRADTDAVAGGIDEVESGFARVSDQIARFPEIGRAHVRTPVTNAHLVCIILLEKKTHNN